MHDTAIDNSESIGSIPIVLRRVGRNQYVFSFVKECENRNRNEYFQIDLRVSRPLDENTI